MSMFDRSRDPGPARVHRDRDAMDLDARPRDMREAVDVLKRRDTELYGDEGHQFIPTPPVMTAAEPHIDVRAFERALADDDPELGHAESFLRLPYGVVISMARAMEGKPPGDDYDEGVAKQAEKMQQWAEKKVGDQP